MMYLETIKDTAKSKAINIHREREWLLVWDKDGKCRAYSMRHDNLHFSVDVLNDNFINVSKIVVG